MRRLVFALTLSTLLGTAGLGQEARPDKSDQEKKRKDRYKNRRTYEVKDPAKFVKPDEKPIFSGPQPSEKIPSFQVVGLTGDNEGKKYDPVVRAKGKYQVLIFQDENGVNVRGLFGIAPLVAKLATKTKKEITSTVVFLHDDPDEMTKKAKRYLGHPRAKPLVSGVSTEGRAGPGALGLDRNVSMTIILVKEGKVTHNFPFAQGMLYPDPHVLGGLAELVGEKRETVTKWLNEADPNRAGERTSAAPAKFREKLAEFVKAGKLTRAEAGELYRAAYPETAGRKE